MTPRRTGLALGLCAAAVAAMACGGSVQRFDPPAEPVTAVSHDAYQVLLAHYVDSDGLVDYARWQASPDDVAQLDSYLAQLAAATPDNRADLFGEPADRLSYWINLYNALVLREVIRRWPLKSVRQVKGGAASYLVPGRGFFGDLRFVVGGRRMSLDDIEHKIIRGRFADARIHFAINCGSSSCPVLRRDAFDAAALEGQLDEASVAFINDPDNVTVDHQKKRIVLSKIFEWYRDDFVAHVRRKHGGQTAQKTGLVDFLLLYAGDDLAGQLARARAQGYKVRYRDYDWSVNAGETAGMALPTPFAVPGAIEHPSVGQAFPDLAFELLDGSPVRFRDLRGKVVLLDVWASYCKPCRASFPEIEALWQRHRPRGFVVVALSQDEQDDLIRKFVADTGVTFPIAVDREQTASEAPLEVSSLPTEILIDRRGVVRFRHAGLPDMPALGRVLETLLAEPSPQ